MSRWAARAIAVLACLGTLLAPLASAAHADDAQVTVISPGGSQRQIALGALAGSEDVVGRPYVLRSAEGESSQTLTGFSLATILEVAGADPYGFSYLEVQRPAGGSVILSRHQALDASAFPEGPPVLYATAAGTGFLRPSGGGDDLNAGDSFEAPQGIAIVLRKGTPLRVRALASTTRTRPGGEVRFKALVERSGSGERLSYSWYFDDGRSAGGAEASHSFARRGSYDVILGVTSAGDSAGASAVVRIQVGAPAAGPDREGGGHNKAPAAPDHGAASGPSGGASGAGAGSAQAGPASVPQPQSQSPEQTPEKRRAPRPAPAGELVSGILVDGGAVAQEQEPTPTQAAARAGSPRSDGRGGLPAGAWGALATVGLLGVGALIEGGAAGALARALPGGGGR